MLPETLPLFPLAGALLLPRAQLPLNIFEPRYLRMVDDALAGARMIGMIQPSSDARPNDNAPPLFSVGGAGRITTFNETEDGRYTITLTGIQRFRLAREMIVDTPYRQGEIDWTTFARDAGDDDTADALNRDEFMDAVRRYLDATGLKTDWEAAERAPIDALVTSLAAGCPFSPSEKQALLEAQTMLERAECLIALMAMAGGDGADGDMLQ